MGKAVEVVNKFYDLYLTQRTMEGVNDLLDQQMRFTGPLGSSPNAAAHLQLLEQVLPAVAGWEKLKQFEVGNEVVTIYELHVQAPNGEQFSVPMSEWTRVSGERVAEQTLYYDPRAFVQAFGM